MRTASLEWASYACRVSWQAITRRNVQHCPVQGDGITVAQYLICHDMQCLVVANVRLFGGYDEVAPEQPRHTGIHQRMWLIVDEQQCCIGHVLSDGGDLFEFFPISAPREPSLDQIHCQSLQGHGTATPETNWSQVVGKFRQVAFGQGCPARVFLQETWQESWHCFCAGPLQEHLYDQANVWGGIHLSPRKLSPLQGIPGDQFAAESGGSVARNRFLWNVTRIHGKIARYGARRLLTHRVKP